MTLKLFGLERKLDEAAKNYVYDLFDPQIKIVCCDSLAGTGKTTMATAVGVVEKQAGKYQNGIVYINFPSKRVEKLGSRPGTLAEKEEAYMKPLNQALSTCGVHQPSGFGVQATTASDFRGITLDNSYVIIDEAQNATIEDLQLVLTRCTDSCKIVIIGCSIQCDNNIKTYGKDKYLPFQVYTKHLLKKKYTRVHTLVKNYRGDISNHADMINQTIKEVEEE